MPEVTINLAITFNANEIDPSLVPSIMDELQDVEPQLLGIAGAFWQAQEKQVFATQGASVGQPWAPNSNGYAHWKRQVTGQSRVGVLTGHLESSIGESISLGPNSISVGTDVPYAPEFEQDSDAEWTAHSPDGRSRFHGTGHPGRILIAVLPSQVNDLIERLVSFLSMRLGIPENAISIVRAA